VDRTTLLNSIDSMVATYGMLETREGWQTLREELAQQPTNSAMNAICAIAAQSRGCKWAIGSSGCSSPVQCPHKRHQ
jgi:hypothetical protein